MKFYKKTKGAALVSVLIAATFLTIIGSTILILSYSNYSMKTVALNSKNNFYETEKDLNAISGKIRSTLSNISVSHVADAKLLLGVDDKNRYDCVAIAKLIYPDPNPEEKVNYKVYGDRNKAIVTISYGYGKEDKVYITASGSTSSPNFVYSSSTSGMIDKITIKNLCVSRENYEEYENSISTDIDFYVEKTMSKSTSASLGSYSLMMDGGLVLKDNTRINAYGNTYIADYDFNGTGTEPGDNGITLDNSAQLTLMGDSNIIYGDINLNGKSVLNVTGQSITVYGNIYVLDDAAFIVNEECRVYIMEGCEIHYVPTSKNNIIPMTLIDEAAPSYETIDLIDKEIFDGILNLNDGTKQNDGLICAISEENKPLDALNGEKAYFYEMGLNGASRTDSVFFGEPIRAIICNEKQINENCGYSLVLNSYANEIVTSNPNSTIISKVPLTVGQVKNVSLTTFGVERFDFITLREKTNLQYDSYACEMRCNIPFTKAHAGWSQGNLTCQVGGFFKEECGDIINGAIGVSTNSSGLSTKPKTVAGYSNWRKDDED